jgi:hypothetical protein
MNSSHLLKLLASATELKDTCMEIAKNEALIAIAEITRDRLIEQITDLRLKQTNLRIKLKETLKETTVSEEVSDDEDETDTEATNVCQ